MFVMILTGIVYNGQGIRCVFMIIVRMEDTFVLVEYLALYVLPEETFPTYHKNGQKYVGGNFWTFIVICTIPQPREQRNFLANVYCYHVGNSYAALPYKHNRQIYCE